MALKRMKSLERKMEKNPTLKQTVCKLIEEYQQKGYAHKITAEELESTPPSEVWYLPMNVVINPKKPGKVRLVWDAAASVDGVSLNTQLLKGPDMLIPLPKIICGFRVGPVAFGGDIKEMFHQLKVRKEDKQALRFVFGTDHKGQPQIYVMDVATFGATCSPYCAQFVKNLVAKEYEKDFPEAAEAIIQKHYVDDYFDSVDTEEQAIKRAQDVRHIHKQGGFYIRNWVSNSPRFLEALGEGSPKGEALVKPDKESDNEHVLGMVWRPAEDVLCFEAGPKKEFEQTPGMQEHPTKRIVLRCLMRQFDPMGFIAPITAYGKLLMQDLWRKGCDWDTKIDEESLKTWQRWRRLMSTIESVKVPRSYFGDARSDEISKIQLHVFADASEMAYGCVGYFRATVRGEVRCALVMSRTKVAPLKHISIPRLELLAAVLGAQLARAIIDMHSLKPEKVVYWIDASVVLSWIHSERRKYKQFVGAKIGEILNLTDVRDWRWVPTNQNVADMLTKWSTEPDMQSDSTWFRGPKFLYMSEDKWPVKEMPPADTKEEMRATHMFHDIVLPDPEPVTTRVSKWAVLLRVIARVIRFVSNLKRKRNGLAIECFRRTNEMEKKLTLAKRNAKDRGQQRVNWVEPNSVRIPLKQEEYLKAEKFLFKLAQAEAYADEIKTLTKNNSVPSEQWHHLDKRSDLYRLTPLLDEDGIIRMEGRTRYADSLAFDLRFPIILPKGHEITRKLILHYHEKNGHALRESVKNRIRQRFFIEDANAEVRRAIKSCMWCRVNKNQPNNPKMAPLPLERLNHHQRPFSYVGVDYFGPVQVTVGRSKQKRWIVLFTCLVVRAVHLEVAHDLSGSACLMAIRRFICRSNREKRIGGPS
ncbi:uncharacterized protein LOC118458427 isoform X2 [Anopheles albimanus]|uniref:uncharacterized protein LOC118458427 isoform X2 n=1 Tax=Anopheles albimanus TaxID=7167 RepID=UPI00164179F6|nr:uncharacterized protein LOC118458427 isoform X2 [Anopheles albimanus]